MLVTPSDEVESTISPDTSEAPEAQRRLLNHAVCVTTFGDLRLPADRACCGHRFTDRRSGTRAIEDTSGEWCPMCDLILSDDLSCVHRASSV